jgi:hypothetical protein
MIKGLPFVTAVFACALGSCQSGGGFGFAQGSPAGKPIAVESIEGAPASVQTAFAGELANAASARLDKEALARLAAKSMDDIATFLAAGPLAPAPTGEPTDDPSQT